MATDKEVMQMALKKLERLNEPDVQGAFQINADAEIKALKAALAQSETESTSAAIGNDVARIRFDEMMDQDEIAAVFDRLTIRKDKNV